MRLLTISLFTAMIATGSQQQTAEPLALHDPPHFKKGQIETATDSGAHSSTATPGRMNAALGTSGGTSTVESRLRAAQSTQPESFEANLALGAFLLETSRAKEAIPFLQSAVRLDEKSIPARHDLSVAFLEENRLADAESLLNELRKEGSTPSIVHLEARWLAASGKPVEAAEKFQRAAETAPTETHLFDWGNHMLAHGAAEPAGKIFAYASGKFPTSARLKVAQGVSHYARGDYERAVEMVCEGIRLAPQDIRPLVFLGQMIGVAPSREREIQKELARFASLYPDHAQAQYFYGLSLLTLGDGKAAERFFRRASEIDPQMPQPHLELGKLLADQGRTPQAIQELETALRLASDSASGHYKLAQLYQRTGQKARADQHFAAYRKLRSERAAREEQERRQRTGLTVSK